MTFTLTDVLLLVIAGTLLVMTIQLMRLSGRVSEAASALKDAIEELRPDLRRLTHDAGAALVDVRKTHSRIDHIAEMVEESAMLARYLLAPLSTRLAGLITGVKTAVAAVRREESHHGNGAESARGE